MKKPIIIVLLIVVEFAGLPVPALAEELTASGAAQLLEQQASKINLSASGSAAAMPTIPTLSPVLASSDSDSENTVAPDLSDQPSKDASVQIRKIMSLRKLDHTSFTATDQVAITIDNAGTSDISPVITNSKGKRMNFSVREVVNQDSRIFRILPPTQLQPGKYTITAKNSYGDTVTQDFTWGVLALNADKSVYTPGETAHIAIAVLDEQGNTVCNAQVSLSVVNKSSGENVVLTTDTKQIKRNDVCSQKEKTLTPDYETQFATKHVGTYDLTLTAVTKNGTYTVADQILVKDAVDFVVQRQSATRIYPVNRYPVSITITANKDFDGVVTDTVPSSFHVFPSDNGVVASSSALFDRSEEVLGAATSAIGMPFEGKHNITEGFGEQLQDPQEKTFYAQYGLAGHDGVDFDMPIGTPVLAVDNGTVTLAKNADYGLTIVIQHSWGKSYYGHLSKIVTPLNTIVTKGQIIAYSGNSGFSESPHLHFGIKPNNAEEHNGYFGKIDPLALLPLSQNQFTQDKNYQVTFIKWHLTLKKGEKKTLSYDYLAPQQSPAFYTVGPLTMSETTDKGKTQTLAFQENRSWQIAVDTTAGQMTLYFQRENADFNTTYNGFTFTPTSVSTTTATGGTSTTNTNATPPTALCEDSTNTGNTFNRIDASSSTSGAERCMGSFISTEVGQAFTITSGETGIASANMWIVDGSLNIVANTNIYLYKYDGSSLSLFATLTSSTDPGTTITQVSWTNQTTSATVSFSPTDHIVAIVTRTISTRVNGSTLSVIFGDTTHEAKVVLNYTAITQNKPDLTGTSDDDFTTGIATTNCTNVGVTYNTKWTCTTPTTGGTVGTVAAGTTGGTSDWLILQNKQGGTLGSVFPTAGANAGNTYVYQTVNTNTDNLDTVSTVVDSTVNSSAGTSPFYHSGLFLWTSNSDYLILEVGYNGTNRGVMLNQNGSISSSTAIANYNRIWLRWVKSGNNYQAGYSTDGSSWTSLGSAFSHASAFTRAGLTVFAGTASTNYSGAFEFFDYKVLAPTLQQVHSRWRNDDGTEVTATWRRSEDVAATADINVNRRLRLEISNTGSATATSTTYRIEYGLKATTCSAISSWTAIPVSATTEKFQLFDSPNVTDATATSNVSGGLTDANTTFVPGQFKDTGNTTSGITLTTSNFTEIEYSFKVTSNVTAGEDYCFRVTNAGSATNFSYSVYPEIVIGDPNINEEHYRWRNDDGAESSVSGNTLYFNPTGDGFAQNFTINAGCSAGSEWDCVDDGTSDTSATAPTDDTSTSSLQLANGVSYYTLADNALMSGATITRLDVFVYASDTGNPNTNIQLGYCTTCDGSSNNLGTAQAVNVSAYTQYTSAFTGLSLTTTDMNNMQLVVSGDGVKAAISTVYVLVTYTNPSATWKANEDTSYAGQSTGQNIRLRVSLANTGDIAANRNYRLEYAAKVGASCGDDETFTTVPITATTEVFEMTSSSNFTDGDATTAQLTATGLGTFSAGKMIQDPDNSSGTFVATNSQYTEMEYNFQANSSALGTYCFRVTDSGTALDTYTVYPEITITAPGPTLDQLMRHGKWFSNGAEQPFTF